MIRGKRVLGIIPARAGSKRLVGKNIKVLCKKPLIQWTIEAALGCDLIDNLIVSTDDSAIATLSEKLGVTIPFLRPAHLSGDESSTIDFIEHAINFYKEQNISFEYVLLLQPTSPLRDTSDILQAIELMDNKQADAILSVCQAEHSPLWANQLDASCSMDAFLKEEVKNLRSQDLPDFYRLNGAIYLVNAQRLLAEKTLFLSDNVFAYKMTREHSVDIDDEIDFLLAEVLLKNNTNLL